MKSTKATRLLAQQVGNFIEAHPEAHDQDSWIYEDSSTVCGTTMCIAGTAAFLVNGLDFKATLDAVRNHGGWEQYGSELLGLDSEEAEVVFYAENDAAKKYIKRIAKGRQVLG